MKLLLTKKPLLVCRSFARTNADPPEQARPICSPVSSAVPIAVRNCTTTSNSFETRQDHFVCSTFRRKGKEICDTHFIRAVVLEEGTLQHMRLVIQCVADYEDAFRRALGAKRSGEAKKELSAKKRTLQKSENRLAELDRLFKRIYEDMVNGKLSEARFQMLADDYEQEQAELRAKIEMLENEIQNQED